jgi:hypothetical protein
MRVVRVEPLKTPRPPALTGEGATMDGIKITLQGWWNRQVVTLSFIPPMPIPPGGVIRINEWTAP